MTEVRAADQMQEIAKWYREHRNGEQRSQSIQ